MSEWRDFCESVELTDRQKQIYDMVCDIEKRHRKDFAVFWSDYDKLKHLLVEEFTGVEIR